MDLAEEVVMKLIGPIQAVGETTEDERRLANLKVLTDLVDELLCNIEVCARAATRQEASMKKIGMHAQNFLLEVYGREDQGA